MSDAVQLAIVASIAPTIAALAALIVGIRNGRKSDAIHALANSQLTAVTTSLKEANAKIEGLQKLVGALRIKK